jgi:hypothetical protein
MKSERVGAAWQEKKDRARRGECQKNTQRMGDGRKALTRRLPAWVRLVEGKLVLDDAKAAVVRKVFALAREGLGAGRIARALNAEPVPVLGRTTFKGRPVKWNETVVYSMLTSRATVGEYQPHRVSGGKRTPAGPPLPDYYPRVIEREEFEQVQLLLKARATVGRGRRGRHVNLFAGLLRDARTGGSLTAKHIRNRSATLIPTDSKQGKNTPWVSYPLALFEKALLASLVEVKVEDVRPGNGAASKVEALSARHGELEVLIGKWRAKMDRPELVDVVADKLAELRNEQRDVAARLAEAQREAASPFSEAWGQFKTAGQALAEDGSDDNRERCRTAIRRVVESVWVLIIPGRPGYGLRVCAVQVFFKSGVCRHYFIACKPPMSNGKKRVEGQVWSKSLAEVTGADDFDLRDRSQVAGLEAALAAIPLGG